MHSDFITTAGIVISMIAVAIGFLGFAALVSCPHALLAGLKWTLKRLGRKWSRR